MSDDNGDAAFEDGATAGPAPAGDGSIDAIHRTLTEIRDLLGRQQVATAEQLQRIEDGLAQDRRAAVELREALLDVASGEVVGALWDEVRETRASVDALAGSEAAPAGDRSGAVSADQHLRDDIAALTDTVRELLAQAEVVTEPAATEGSAGVLDTVAADLAALRSELSEGLVVEPSEALAGTVDQLRAELAGLDERLQALTDRPQPAADAEGELQTLRTGVEGVDRELRALRTGVEDIIGRLDEGIVLADEVAPPAGGAAAPELSDQFASLRDHVATEFDALGQLLERMSSEDRAGGQTAAAGAGDLAPITELLEHVRDDIAELPDRLGTRTPPAPASAATGDGGYAPIDPDTIDLLREEIRTSGGVAEDVIAALRNDLVALRRRIKLRAEGELFTEEQLDHIADAVARRLAE